MRVTPARWSVGAAFGSALLVAPFALAAPASASTSANEIVYVQLSGDPEAPTSSVLLRDLLTGATRSVLPEGDQLDATPELSPDGTQVVLESSRVSGAGGLVVVGRGGGGLVPLTTNADVLHEDASPTWNGPGTVVFERRTLSAPDQDGFQEFLGSALYAVPTAGGPVRALGYDGESPDVSPNGSQVVFSSSTGSLSVGTLAGAPAVPLGVSGAEPSWSPDGTEIAYWAESPGGTELHVVGANGSGDRVLAAASSGGVNPLAPAWLPDGQSLAYDAVTPDEETIYTVDRLGERAGPLLPTSAGQTARFGANLQGPEQSTLQNRSAASQFVPVTPVRVYDSRPGQEPAQGPKTRIPAGQTVPLALAPGAVPATATAVVLNVTVVDPSAQTYVSAYPTGSAFPLTSNVNLLARTNVPNNVTVKLGTGGSVTFRNAEGTTDLVVDLSGYYVPTVGAPVGASGFGTVVPFRAYDSRPGQVPTDVTKGRLGAGIPVDVTVAGVGGVPADATAVVVNITGIAPSATTLLRAYATPVSGAAVPLVSNVNLTPNSNTANLAVVAVGADGRIRLRNEVGTADVAVDVTGFYSLSAPGEFIATDPLRLLDTRNGTGAAPLPLGAADALRLRLDRRGLPAGATAVVANVTGVVPTAATLLQTYPADAATVPTVSTLNLTAGSIRANAAYLVPDASGAVKVRNVLGRVQVLADVAGYFVTD